MAETLPGFLGWIERKHVKLIYRLLVNNFLKLILVPVLIAVAIQASRLSTDDVMEMWWCLDFEHDHVLLFALAAALVATVYYMSRPRAVYLVDFACYTPPPTCRAPYSTFMEHATLLLDDPKSVHFVTKMFGRSGLGEETCLPPAVHYLPPQPTMESSRKEAETVMFSCLDALFAKTSTKPKDDVDILIVNCSLFSPTPSLSAMIINHYKLRSNILSFNLSGMGCSAGLISLDLARRLLQFHPNSTAVVVSTEIITPNYYTGTERAMLLPNCLFRMGAAALLLSNKPRHRRAAKYSLLHVVRTHMGADDAAYRCVYETEDPAGNTGISLSKDLMIIAGNALKANITTIGPLVLPASEQLLFLLTLIGRKLFNAKWKPYIPDFKQAFEHFCIHAGGRAVIDELQKSLNLSAEHVEASRMTLHRFGNTSSSSLWYEMAYMEAKGKMKKGDRVWQIAFGSGFKCNSAVWRCNRSVKPPVDGPWAGCVDRYPVHIPEVVKV